MKNFKLLTILFSLFLLQSVESVAQTEGLEMPASDIAERLIINYDGTNHYSRIRFQTDNYAYNLRNGRDKLELLYSASTNWTDLGETIFSLDGDGKLVLKSTSFLEDMRFITGNATNGLKVYANESLDWSMNLMPDGQMIFQNQLTVGSTSDPVDGTVMTVDGRVHISPKFSVIDAQFDENQYGDFLLWVDGGIVSEDFVLEDASDWADFVFAPEYELRTLEEVEAFVIEHGHLPGMSSETVVKEGYTMHEMNKQLLQVIEELTLHTIEQNKQLTQLLQEVEKLEQQ